MQKVNHLQCVIDKSSLKYLRVKGGEKGEILRITLPWMPWKVGKARGERRMLIEKLFDVYPTRVLWLSEWSSDTACGWNKFDSVESFFLLKDDLVCGDWLLSFFQQENNVLREVSQLAPSEIGIDGAVNKLKELGAEVVIHSFYDDIEWFLHITGSGLTFYRPRN